MLHQAPGVKGAAPVIASVSALLLRHHQAHPGVLLPHDRQRGASSPLETYAFDVFPGHGIRKHRVDQRHLGPLARAEPHIDALPFHPRSQMGDEACQAGGGPAAAGEVLVRIGFVLRHHHRNVDAMLPVSLDIPLKIQGIRLQVFLLLDKHILSLVAPARLRQVVDLVGSHRIVMVVLHP